MTRTNIDLDDRLVAEVMRRFGVATKKDAVDLALRRLVGTPLSRDFLLSLEGTGWEGDLAAMRHDEMAPVGDPGGAEQGRHQDGPSRG